jgi:WD40 repeat protein
MKDEKTIFGVQQLTKRMIIKEDITGVRSDACPVLFYKHTNIVNTVMVSEELNVMLAGDDNGNVVQYDLTTGRIQIDYGNLRIGDIVSLQCIGPIAIVGGWRTNLLRILFMDSRQVFGPVFKTSIHYLSSLQMCFVHNPKNLRGNRMLLCISGYNPKYNNHGSDVYDATDLIKYYQNTVNPKVKIVDFDKKPESEIEFENQLRGIVIKEIKKVEKRIKKIESKISK